VVRCLQRFLQRSASLPAPFVRMHVERGAGGEAVDPGAVIASLALSARGFYVPLSIKPDFASEIGVAAAIFEGSKTNPMSMEKRSGFQGTFQGTFQQQGLFGNHVHTPSRAVIGMAPLRPFCLSVLHCRRVALGWFLACLCYLHLSLIMK
jgi:hypothetical protein